MTHRDKKSFDWVLLTASHSHHSGTTLSTVIILPWVDRVTKTKWIRCPKILGENLISSCDLEHRYLIFDPLIAHSDSFLD